LERENIARRSPFEGIVMKHSVYYSVVGTCAFVSVALICSMLRSGLPKEQIIRVAAAVPVVQTDPTQRCDVTRKNYKRLQTGMSYSLVRDIFGCNGTETHRLDVYDVYIHYKWDIPGGGGTTLTFKNDGLIDKSWSGS